MYITFPPPGLLLAPQMLSTVRTKMAMRWAMFSAILQAANQTLHGRAALLSSRKYQISTAHDDGCVSSRFSEDVVRQTYVTKRPGRANDKAENQGLHVRSPTEFSRHEMKRLVITGRWPVCSLPRSPQRMRKLYQQDRKSVV